MEVRSREEFERLKVLPFFKGVIKSDSMEPLIKVGERISVEVGVKELRRFDIIVFWRDEEKALTCHYLWAMNRIVTPQLFQTRSIRYGGKDYPISKEDYLGKVVSHRLTLRHKLGILFRYLIGSVHR